MNNQSIDTLRPIKFVRLQQYFSSSAILPHMFILTLLLSLLVISVSGCDDHAKNSSIPLSTRIHWMRRANAALAELSSPCPFAAFGTAIVNHTAGGLGELVCIGINSNSLHGDPTLHGEGIPSHTKPRFTHSDDYIGEIAAIQNCSKVLTDPAGPYKLSPRDAISAFKQLSLYTNAESCPMVMPSTSRLLFVPC